MKREDLTKLGLSDDAQIDAIMKLHGSDIEGHKTKITELQGQYDGASAQLTEANKAIESFKALKPEELQKAADDWKTKYEQAQQESAAQLSAVKFDHALDSALGGVKAKNPKAVKALLDMDTLKKAYDEKTGTIIGFEEHIKPVKTENEYLFESANPPPRIVAGGNSQPVVTDPIIDAFRKGAGLKTE